MALCRGQPVEDALPLAALAVAGGVEEAGQVAGEEDAVAAAL